ncbi:MAG: cytochrome c oxidase subunit II [Janthinobacterium lividum]
MMRAIVGLALAALAFLPAALDAQASGVAAPVVPVTTQAVPAAQAPPIADTLPTPGIGMPRGGITVQEQFTPIGREAKAFHNGLLDPLMLAICLVVFALLGYTLFRFRASRSPTASRTSHNTVIEVIWTVAPVLILVWIAVPSFRLLARQYQPPKAGLTIKATGHQWYWEYEYPDQGGFSFDSIILSDADARKHGDPEKLGVDNRVVVPVGTTVRVLTTAADVIHAWAVPSFWVQMDAVPGRINETWFKVDRSGVYYGQCFQLCGTKHAFMPIAVEVVSKEQFAQWVAAKQKENGITPPSKATSAAITAGAIAGSSSPAPAGGSNPAEAVTAVKPAVATTDVAAPKIDNPAAPTAPAATK